MNLDEIDKELINERLVKVVDALDDAASEAEEVLHTVRVHGITGTRYLQLLRACEKLRDRAQHMSDKLMELE